MFFGDELSKKIYDNLVKLKDTDNLEYLNNAIKLSGYESDVIYQQKIEMDSLIKSGKKLVLYGIGKDATNFYELEKDRKNTVGYLYVPFLGDVKWYDIGDKNRTGQFMSYQISNMEDLLKSDDGNFIYYIASSDYYEQIKCDFLNLGIDENRIKKYCYPNTQVYEDKQYFDDFVSKKHEDIFIEGGCYRCDSMERFIEWNKEKGYNKIISFEPDKENYKICKDIIIKNKWKNVDLINAGLSDADKSLYIIANGDDTSYINDSCGDEIRVKGIDDTLKEYEGKCTFLKLDVEGFEYETLVGAKNTIIKDHPTMAISLYHKKEDIETIPNLIRQYSDDYTFYLRMYSNAYLEIILYAL